MKGRPRKLVLMVATGAVAGLLFIPAGGAVRAGSAADPAPVPAPSIPGVAPLPGPLAAPAPSAQNIKLLKVTPDSAPIGTKFTVTGTDLPPNQDVDIVWDTWNGSYVMKPTVETVEYYDRQFDAVSVILGRGRTDASGNLSVNLTVPEDYGEIHDMWAVAGGVKIAKGGYHISRRVTIDKKRGPLGTLITIKATGVGRKPYENTLAVRYDNKYVGYMSAVLTRGTAIAQIRAAGPVGTHVIEVDGASGAVPYLNVQQSPVSYIGEFKFRFTVTKDNGAPADVVQFPSDARANDIYSRTTLTGTPAAGVTAKLSSQHGQILSKVDLTASGLAPDAPATLTWVTAVGNRLQPSGWSLSQIPLSVVAAASDGTLKTTVEVPDNLGGWHALRVVQQGKLMVELPYFVERSFVKLVPAGKVKAGEIFQFNVKGIGWTELDNGAAVVYDNSYLGYACGFNSNGDIKVSIVATGGPGTHLIDIYPMIYLGHGKGPWAYNLPILTYNQDAPGLSLGYRLPVIRLAIEVVR